MDCYIDKARMPGNVNVQNKISSDLSQTLVHKWRSEEQAIMIGTNTALNDNPKLNVRNWSGNDPLRLVLDKNLRLPMELHLFDQSVPTIVFTQKKKQSIKNLQYRTIDFNNLPLELCKELYAENIQSLLIEGGAILLNAFIDAGLWDEAKVFISPKHFIQGVSAPVLKNAALASNDSIQEDYLYFYKNMKQ